MIYKIRVVVFAFILFAPFGGQTIFARNFQTKPPRVFLLDARNLAKEKSRKNDAATKSAIAELEKDARKALNTEINSIASKKATPPSGDRRDYMSQAPYFWKNSDTKDGFPYVRRDGERNPEIKQYPDHDFLDRMIETVEPLAFGFYFTGDETYAKRAAEILRFWFVDERTRMNPNLEYAQAIPGLNTGRGIGIIETRNLPRVVDAIGLLENSKAWSNSDQKNLENWFDKYLTWLLTSKNGRDEATSKNNHGTFYDAQTASFALFVGKKDLAKKIMESAKQNRLAAQIAKNGEQPFELERTKSWDYSVMNLDGLTQLAILGESVGVDLWHFETAQSGSIKRAIDYLFQFKDNEKNWQYKQIEPLKIEKLYPPMRRANRIYKDEKLAKTLAEISSPTGWENILLQ